MNTVERWATCRKFENYEISSFGRVRRVSTGKILSPFRQNRGYLQIKLSQDREIFRPTIHRLVADAFIGISKLEVNHIDCDKSNNRVDNLEYVTHRQNVAHSIKNGRHKPLKPNCKITFEDAQEIRRIYECGELGYALIAKKYFVSKSNIQAIIKGRSWANK